MDHCAVLRPPHILHPPRGLALVVPAVVGGAAPLRHVAGPRLADAELQTFAGQTSSRGCRRPQVRTSQPASFSVFIGYIAMKTPYAFKYSPTLRASSLLHIRPCCGLEMISKRICTPDKPCFIIMVKIKTPNNINDSDNSSHPGRQNEPTITSVPMHSQANSIENATILVKSTAPLGWFHYRSMQQRICESGTQMQSPELDFSQHNTYPQRGPGLLRAVPAKRIGAFLRCLPRGGRGVQQ